MSEPPTLYEWVKGRPAIALLIDASMTASRLTTCSARCSGAGQREASST